MTRLAAILLLASVALAHGDHGHGHSHGDGAADDPSLGYAERHMAAEHHIDSFDLGAFFKLHDLDLDGFWDRDEIAALYGLRHHSVAGKAVGSKGPGNIAEQAKKEREIVEAVLGKLDKDGDGRVSLEEFVGAGKNSLPVIGDFKDLGHHYDEESEYFLHHEEVYHNTPETQTDESYTHPEDIEHFKHHARIEAEEDARERKFEGLAANADLEKDHAAHDPLADHAHAPGEGAEAAAQLELQGSIDPEDAEAEEPIVHDRQAKNAQERFRAERNKRTPPKRLAGDIKKHHHRHSDADRVRKDAPYKHKVRQGLRSDEF